MAKMTWLQWLSSGLIHRRSELGLAVAAAFAFALVSTPAVRVGDGSDYYAMFFAWRVTFLPFMTAASWDAYSNLAASGAVSDVVSLRALRDCCTALQLKDTADFYHFWFYSAIAAAINFVASALHITQSTHAAFVTLHWLLFSLTLAIARRWFGWAGVFVAVLLTLSSPIVWYANKVHTEFLTYCSVLAGIICVLRQRFIAAALFLAVPSTQNPSFAAIALLLLIIDRFARRGKRYSAFEAAAIAATIGLTLLHPAYYFFRYGTITPLFLSGGAKVGLAGSSWYIWLIDPDIGLLPNWPLGVVLALFAVMAAIRRDRIVKESPFWWIFVGLFVVISLVAQSSTINLNSGGTRGVARYALWYVPLFFPLGISAFEWAARTRVRLVLASGLALFCIALNLVLNRPQLPESYSTPSIASVWIQERLPSIYYPPEEVFSERYGGIGEHVAERNPLAIVGPDCRKVLLFHRPNATLVLGGSACGYDRERLGAILRSRLERLPAATGSSYIRLSDNEAQNTALSCSRRFDFAKGGNADGVYVEGLGAAENHGRWNDGPIARFSCTAGRQGQRPSQLALTAHGFVVGGRSPRMTIDVNGAAAPDFVFETAGEKLIELMIPSDRDIIVLTLGFPDRISPQALGMSADARLLAVGVRAIEFK
ncbi:MAG TPA: hypothetical protein VNG69_01665 [Casimicrobiaceae bacterium]|nr:hypothetical protein [Casimicrobiaceae bacterium]